jgi:hypothetical protein
MKKLDILTYLIIGVFIGVCIYIYLSKLEGFGFDLKCIISKVDGNEYCVREREKIDDAADLLAIVTEKCKKLVEYVKEKHPDKEFTKRLVDGFNPKKVMETLPTSKYTAYSENKGEKIAFCLNRKKTENDNLIDEHTLTFVAIHELSHVGTTSIGHKSDFWENFKFLLQCAKESGIHNPADYKMKPKDYCGMTINDNPYYDM